MIFYDRFGQKKEIRISKTISASISSNLVDSLRKNNIFFHFYIDILSKTAKLTPFE